MKTDLKKFLDAVKEVKDDSLISKYDAEVQTMSSQYRQVQLGRVRHEFDSASKTGLTVDEVDRLLKYASILLEAKDNRILDLRRAQKDLKINEIFNKAFRVRKGLDTAV